MASKGWVKMYRQIQDCWIWEDKPFAYGQAWTDLVLLANHQETKIPFDGKLVTVERGQFITSVRKLSERWGWHKDKTLNFLRLCESDGMLIREADTRRTLLTIVNYENFQDEQPQEQTPSRQSSANSSDTEQTPSRQSSATNKNEKNEKNEKNVKKYKDEVYFPNDSKLNDAFKDYVAMRKQIKSPMTDKAIELAIKKLETLSGGDNDKAILILEQSIMNSWKGLFELKETKTTGKKQSNLDTLLNQLKEGKYDT